MDSQEKEILGPVGNARSKRGGRGKNPDEAAERKRKVRYAAEGSAKALFLMCAVFSTVAVLSIVGFLLYRSFPAFREIGVFQFLFGTEWLPEAGTYGIFYMILGSICVTLGALIIGGVIGVFSAVFLARFCPKAIKKPLEQVVNLLAGIPSIIYGGFGLAVLLPLLQSISPKGMGEGVLACSLLLGIMILPTVVSISKTSIESVDESYYEGAIALGASKPQAVFRVVLPSAKSGVIAALVLGVGRAIGETMAVLMVAGNSNNLPKFFGYIRTLTINIVQEMGYAEGLHKNALIATGLVLLIFVLLINSGFHLIRTALEKRQSNGGRSSLVVGATGDFSMKEVPFRKTGAFYRVLKGISIACASLTALMLAAIVLFVLIKGIPCLTFDRLFGKTTFTKATLWPAFVSTGWLILITLLIAVPIGVAAAIYMVEYAKKGSRIVKVIRMFTETLSGVPSIVFGLFGVILFCDLFGLGRSLLSGSFTLVLIILPTIIRSTEESLMAVPDSLREASLAMGAGKLRTIFRIVLPNALAGILTAVILSIGRIVGESAALIYTAGSVTTMPKGLGDEGSSFAVLMYTVYNMGFTTNAEYEPVFWSAATVLIFIVILLNCLVALVESLSKRKLGAGSARSGRRRQAAKSRPALSEQVSE